MRALTRQRAFTLLEVMLSLGVFAIVSVLLMDMMVRQSRSYTVVDNVAEAQEKVRAVASLMEQEVRGTGFLVPIGGVFCGYDTAAAPDGDTDVFYVSNTEALTPPPPPPAPPTSSFERFATVTSAVPAGGIGVGTQTLTINNLVLDAPAFYDLNGDAIGDSDFRGPTGAGSPAAQQGGVIVFDAGDPAKGAACGRITSINLGGSTVTVDFTSAGAAPGGTPLGPAPYGSLAVVPAHGYWINVLAGVPRLMRDGIVMAEDVEDLQVAAFFDALDDGIITALGPLAPLPWHNAAEYPGSAAVGSAYISGARDNSELREIRVTVVARTRSEDPDVVLRPALANYFQQRPENRVILGVLAADGFRRRAVTMAIAPRNVLMR